MSTPDHGSPSSDYGSPADQREYLRKHGRKRNQLLKQFCKLESGNGNSEAFREGWVQAFGKHQCSGCGRRFEWTSELDDHIASAHGTLVRFAALAPPMRSAEARAELERRHAEEDAEAARWWELNGQRELGEP